MVLQLFPRLPLLMGEGLCWHADTEKSRALFEFADANRDGVIDTREFSVFLENTRAANAEDATVRPLTSKELKQLFSRSAIGWWPFLRCFPPSRHLKSHHPSLLRRGIRRLVRFACCNELSQRGAARVKP